MKVWMKRSETRIGVTPSVLTTCNGPLSKPVYDLRAPCPAERVNVSTKLLPA
jgi:hypothetical protein